MENTEETKNSVEYVSIEESETTEAELAEVNGGLETKMTRCPRCGQYFTNETILKHLNGCGLVKTEDSVIKVSTLKNNK